MWSCVSIQFGLASFDFTSYSWTRKREGKKSTSTLHVHARLLACVPSRVKVISVFHMDFRALVSRLIPGTGIETGDVKLHTSKWAMEYLSLIHI